MTIRSLEVLSAEEHHGPSIQAIDNFLVGLASSMSSGNITIPEIPRNRKTRDTQPRLPS